MIEGKNSKNQLSDTNTPYIKLEENEEFFNEVETHLENIEMNCLILEAGNDVENSILEVYRSFHGIKGLSGFLGLKLVESIAHQTETLINEIRENRIKSSQRAIDHILKSSDFIKELCRNTKLLENEVFVKSIKSHLKCLEYFLTNQSDNACRIFDELDFESDIGAESTKIGEIMVAQGKIASSDVEYILNIQNSSETERKFGEIALKEKKAETVDIINAIRIQRNIKNRKKDGEEFIKLSSDKIRLLTEVMGEYITLQSLIEEEAILRLGISDSFSGDLLTESRKTKKVQNLVSSLKMVSLSPIFNKMQTIAESTAKELGKNVKLIFVGEETEIDRDLSEKIIEILMHIVKNSISHGIEDNETRNKNNKHHQGIVKLEAYSKSGNICIEVADDGAGISPGKIHEKAVQKKLINPNVNYTEAEMIDFIFLPGFSTADTVNSISGRGVGLDVVKTELSKIGGKIEINSNVGKGTTFIIKIPVNKSIMNGIIVQIGSESYIIPTSNVKHIYSPAREERIRVGGNATAVKFKDTIIQLISMEKFLGNNLAEDPNIEDLVIILENRKKYKALNINSVLGRKEVSVKPLDDELNLNNVFTGASILGNGKVTLVLNIESLFRLEE